MANDKSGSFESWIKLCEKIESVSGHSDKTNILKKYLENEFK